MALKVVFTDRKHSAAGGWAALHEQGWCARLPLVHVTQHTCPLAHTPLPGQGHYYISHT